jgi:hypothetical protein
MPKRAVSGLMALLVVIACGSAEADPDAEAGSSSSGGVDESSGEEGASSSSGGEACIAARIVVLDFDGIVLAQGGADDATQDLTSAQELVGTWEPVDDTIHTPVVVQGIAQALAPFDVAVTTERPATGAYSLVVFTRTPIPAYPAAPSLGRPNCGAARATEIGLAVPWDEPSAVLTGLALIGMSFGLELTNGEDAMAVTPAYAPSYHDTCAELYGDVAYCSHPECPDGQQNSYAQLLATLGPTRGCQAP